MEEWKWIEGHEGNYEVSSHGRVRSWSAWSKGKCLEPSIRKGYPMVSLMKQGQKKSYDIHVLVLATFVGDCPEGMEGCHNDGNKTNNSLLNLRWDTHKNNIADKNQHGNLFAEYCSRNHALTDDNIYVRPNSKVRECKICKNMRNKKQSSVSQH